jgi:uncharacterized membrane protein YfcA
LHPAAARRHNGRVDATDLLAQGAAPLLLLAAVLFVAGCLNGATGIGFANLSSVALALLLDARTAVILLAGVTPLVLLMPVLRYRAEAPRALRLLTMFAAMPLGVLLGSYLLVALPVAVIALGLGLVTIVSALAAMRRGNLSLPPGWERVCSPLIGVVAGTANSAVGVSGPILAMYLLALGLEKALFAFIAAAMFTAMGVLRLLTLVAFGELTATTVALSLALCVPAALGIRAGFWLQPRIDQRAFNRLVLGILVLTGAQLIWRGLTGLHVFG